MGDIKMAKTTVILNIDGQKEYLTQVSISEAITKLKQLDPNTTVIEFLSIEGINAVSMYQNFKNQISKAIEVFEMFEPMSVEDIAICLLLNVTQKIPILETPEHKHLIKSAQRVSSVNSLKSQALHFMQFMEWQGFEFLAP